MGILVSLTIIGIVLVMLSVEFLFDYFSRDNVVRRLKAKKQAVADEMAFIMKEDASLGIHSDRWLILNNKWHYYKLRLKDLGK